MSARNPAAELSPAALIRGSVAPEETRTTQESWAWRAMEASITLGILLLVVLSVADSVHAAGWVDGMPDVRLTALLALGVAVGMSTGLVHWTLAYVGGIGLGAVVVLRQVLQREQFTGQSWFWERFVELRFRLEDWFSQAFNDGITTDNVPFVFFVVVGVWLATFPAALLVLRRRNPWPMLIVLGVLLSINVSYLDGKQWDFHFAFFAAGAALLVMRTSLLTRMARWQERGTPFPDFISVSFFAVTLVGVVGLMVVSRAVPRPDRADPLTQFWSGITSPFDDLSLEFERLFSGIDSQRGAPIHNFGANFHPAGRYQPGTGYCGAGGRAGGGAAAWGQLRPLHDSWLAAERDYHVRADSAGGVPRGSGEPVPGASGGGDAAVGGAVAAGAVHVWPAHGDQPSGAD